jgi:hypothetical protein
MASIVANLSRHREEQSDEAIQLALLRWIASPRSQ